MPTDLEWKKIRKEKEEQIKKAINQKEKSIAYMNSVNSAIALIKDNYKNLDLDDMKKSVLEWRDWFYARWQEWYLENMDILEKTTPTWAKSQTPKVVKQELIQEVAEEGRTKEKIKEELEEINSELSTNTDEYGG